MKDIQIFLLSGKEVNLENANIPKGYGLAKEEFENQSLAYNLKTEITTLDRESLPKSVDCKLIGIFDQNALVHKRYLLNIVSMKNMLHNVAIFCGPSKNFLWSTPNDPFLKSICDLYKTYFLNSISGAIVKDITGEIDNYPLSTNIFITKPAYNNVGGFQPLQTPRGECFSNPNFVSHCDTYGSIIYSDSLKTMNCFDSYNLSISHACRFFYDLGFISGLNSKSKCDEEASYDFIWDMFVESPDSLDHRAMGGLFYNNQITENKETYAQHTAMAKCAYQVGFFEALSGNVLL